MKRVVSAMLIAVVVLSLLCTMASADIVVQDIGVSLCVSGGDVSVPGYFKSDYEGESDIEGSYFQLYTPHLGEDIKFTMTTANMGSIQQYEKVSFYSRWRSPDGGINKLVAPCYLSFNTLTERTPYERDRVSSTAERTILYFSTPVEVGGGRELYVSAEMPDSVQLSWAAPQANWVRNTDGTWSTCSDIRVNFGITVDVVQDHNAADAMWTQWGVRVSIDETGRLTIIYDE